MIIINHNPTTATNVIDHVLNHHRNYGLARVYICYICAQEFTSYQGLMEHYAESHVIINDQNNNSEEQENIDYLYRCPVCEIGYNDHISINMHFMQRHNNYSELNMLDQLRSDGFPGFKLLIKIKMIRYVREDEPMDSDMYIICGKSYDRCVSSSTDDQCADDQCC